jgi:hypothetical protein
VAFSYTVAGIRFVHREYDDRPLEIVDAENAAVEQLCRTTLGLCGARRWVTSRMPHRTLARESVIDPGIPGGRGRNVGGCR